MKNKMMRAASVLMVAVLLSTCAISGTFAKYVTSATSGDTARVAKWGITMSDNGAATFVDSYDSGAVMSATPGDDVVAPGTKGSTTYKVYGAPETAYDITFTGTVCTKDMMLGKGTYTYGAQYVGMNATLADDAKYYPIDWKVTIAWDATAATVAQEWTQGESRTYATLTDAMNALAAVKVSFKANEESDMVVTVEWEWDYDTTTGTIAQDTYTSNNVYDTILGDLQAGNEDLAVAVDSVYELNAAYTVTMTATQID